MEEPVWKDRIGNLYCLDDIDDRYLSNIINFLKRGGGHHKFLDKTKIKRLYEEAIKRNLKIDVKLEDLITIHRDVVERMELAECFNWYDMLD